MKNKITYIIFLLKFLHQAKIMENFKYENQSNNFKEKKLVFINSNYSIYSIKGKQSQNLYIIKEINQNYNYPSYYTGDQLIKKEDILGIIKNTEKKIKITILNFDPEETYISYTKIEKPESKKITFYLIKSEKKKYILILKYFLFEKQKFIYKFYLLKSYKNNFGAFLINEYENSMDFDQFGIYKQNGFYYLHMGNQIYIYYIQSFFGKYLFNFENIKIFSPFKKENIHIEKIILKNNLLFLLTNHDLKIYYFKIINNLESFKLVHKKFQNILLNKKYLIDDKDNFSKLNFKNEIYIYEMKVDFFLDFCLISLKSDENMKFFFAKNFRRKTKILEKKQFYDLNFYSLFEKMNFSILNYLDKDEFLNLINFKFVSQKTQIQNFSDDFSEDNKNSKEIKMSQIEINNLKTEALEINFLIKDKDSIMIKRNNFCPDNYKLKTDLFNYCEINSINNKNIPKKCEKIILQENNISFSKYFFTCAKYKDFSNFTKEDIKKIQNFKLFKNIKKTIYLQKKYCGRIKNKINCFLQHFCIFKKGKCKLNLEKNVKKEYLLTNGFLEDEQLINKLKTLKLSKKENRCNFHREERNKKILINYNNPKNPSNSKNKLIYEAFTFCKTEIKFQNYRLSSIYINPDLKYSFPDLNTNIKNYPILIFEKFWINKKGEEKNFIYFFRLDKFLYEINHRTFNLYTDKINIYIIFPNKIKFENHFKIKIENSGSRLLFNVFLFVFMLISFLLSGYFIYLFWGYFYNILYLRRYDMGILDWLQGKRVRINFQYYVKNGFIKIKNYQEGTSFFEEEQCSICRSEYIENQKILELKCKHIYHKLCLTQWHKLSDSNKTHKCIICNQSLD